MPPDPRASTVVISGGGTGIGAASAERFAADGANVAILGRRKKKLTEVADRTGAMAISADMTNPDEVSAALEEIIDRFGSLDTVVANAGGHGLSPAGSTADEKWAASLLSNVTTAFVLVRAALPHLMRSAGSIVVVTSLAAHFAGPSVVGYTAGKHALLGLMKSLARDYGKFGIRANAVSPGWVRTPMADEEMDTFQAHADVDSRQAAYARVTQDVPLGRPAEPAEIASIIRFLASDEASAMTGAALIADGGAHIVDVPTIEFARAGM
jgi:NAD(P)-dependent dehydrogenase (short-subunit alcohol dehydrogenase family)